MSARLFSFAALLALVGLMLSFVPACGDSVKADAALEEPLRFHYKSGTTTYDAQFFAGDMPAPNGGPAAVGFDVGAGRVSPGTQNHGGYTVRVGENGYSVAVRLQGRTEGYWVARVNALDPLSGGIAANISFDVSTALPVGNYELEACGIDINGNAGPRLTAAMNVVPRLDTSGPAVISLKWDAAVDLDLQLATPDGTFLSPKRATTVPVGTADAGAGYGQLDGDSVASCIDDGFRQEDIVWNTAPIPGTYKIYVNAFSMCHLPGTNYEVQVYRNGAIDQSYYGNFSAVEVQQGGYQLGYYIADVTF